MLAAAERWGGGEDERPYLARAFSIARVSDGEAHYLLEDVGPGTRRLCELAAGERLWVLGPLGRASRRRGTGGGRCSSAAASGSRRWRSGRTELARGADTRAGAARLSRRPARAGRGAAAARRSVATDDGSAGHHGLVTELLAEELDEDGARDRLRLRAGADAGGGQGDLRDAGGPGAARAGGGDGLRVRRLLRVRRAAARRRLPAGVRRWPGDRRRPSWIRSRPTPERPAMSVAFCGLELAHPIINGSGTFDALAAREGVRGGAERRIPVRGVRLEDDHAGAPRRQSAAAAVGDPGRAGQLDRAAEQGPRGLSGRGPARAGEPAGAADHERDGLQRARSSPSSCRPVTRAAEIAGDRAERVLPEREDGPRHRRRSTPAGAGRASGPPAHRQAADREADAERGRCRSLRAGGAGGGADAVSLINTLRACALAPASRGGRGGPRRLRRGWEAARAAVGSRDPRRRTRPGGGRGGARGDPRDRHGRGQQRGARARAARCRRAARGDRDGELPRSRRRGTRGSTRRAAAEHANLDWTLQG